MLSMVTMMTICLTHASTHSTIRSNPPRGGSVAVSMVLSSDEAATAELRLVEPPISPTAYTRTESANISSDQSMPSPRITDDRLTLPIEAIRPNPRNPRRHYDDQAL